VGDIDRTYYRSREEEKRWADERDPLKILAGSLASEGAADATALDRLEEEVRTEISEGVRFALEAPYPGPEEVTMHVYA
jgi:pyruvate dehydrogenase E1 component alpha subunit